MDEHSELPPLPSQGRPEQGSGHKEPHDSSESQAKTAPGTASDTVDDVYEVIIGNRRYFATMVNGVEVSVRVPLHIWNEANPQKLEAYADELLLGVLAERRKQSPVANRALRNMTKLIL